MLMRTLTGGIIVAALVWGNTPHAQTPDSSSELLTEVRALRADLQQVAKISLEAQLLVGRLQLQEQRLTAIGGQLVELRRLVGIKDHEIIEAQDRLKRWEDISHSATVTADVQRDIASQIPSTRTHLARITKELADLHVQETELMNQVTAEQARWVDFNSRLDELERQLPVSKR